MFFFGIKKPSASRVSNVKLDATNADPWGLRYPFLPFGSRWCFRTSLSVGNMDLVRGYYRITNPNAGIPSKLPNIICIKLDAPPKNRSHLMTPEPQQMIPGEELWCFFFGHCKSTLHIGESLEPKFQSFNRAKWWLRNWRMINLTLKKMVGWTSRAYNIYNICISYYEVERKAFLYIYIYIYSHVFWTSKGVIQHSKLEKPMTSLFVNKSGRKIWCVSPY